MHRSVFSIAIAATLVGSAGAQAQHVRLKVNQLTAHTTTEPGDQECLIFNCGNTNDELYFAIAGAVRFGSLSGDVQAIDARVPKKDTQPRDIIDLAPGASLPPNRTLWEGRVPAGQSAVFVVVVADQDNSTLDDILRTIGTFGGALASVFCGPCGAAIANAANAFVDAIGDNADDVIGAFRVEIQNQNERYVATWIPMQSTTMLFSNQIAGQFRMSGEGSAYSATISIESIASTAPAITAVHSDLRMDVRGAGLTDQDAVDQNVLTSSSSQRWRLNGPKAWEYTHLSGFLPMPVYTIQNDNSYRCLDVAGGSRFAGAAIQQYKCHNGANQDWLLIPSYTGETILMNRHSRMCLDIPWASRSPGVQLQQHDCHRGANQRFRIR